MYVGREGAAPCWNEITAAALALTQNDYTQGPDLSCEAVFIQPDGANAAEIYLKSATGGTTAGLRIEKTAAGFMLYISNLNLLWFYTTGATDKVRYLVYR